MSDEKPPDEGFDADRWLREQMQALNDRTQDAALQSPEPPVHQKRNLRDTNQRDTGVRTLWENRYPPTGTSQFVARFSRFDRPPKDGSDIDESAFPNLKKGALAYFTELYYSMQDGTKVHVTMHSEDIGYLEPTFFAQGPDEDSFRPVPMIDIGPYLDRANDVLDQYKPDVPDNTTTPNE